MSPFFYVVWEWQDKDGTPRYVGFGRMDGTTHPADTTWKDRHKVKSDLNTWLCELKKEPQRDKKLPSTQMHRRDAMGVAEAQRTRHRKKKIPLLSKRPHGTCIGGGAKRAVIFNGDVYESVRAAADDLGLNPCTITRRCHKKTDGWSYLEDLC